ncbi:deoxyguanosinetriphosphate triphosphohydrolase [Chroococcidiopsis sp. TS-821]|uniref:deoxyguanosinetriphosphate triphosphohydrolase n=2 Tax=Chroococcidiopsis sp. TS-821 TaxID=1378066 RepID=UPI000CEF1239|nr:deoxyguanosinetriphosphate triphosphohydrolase [Chroococcidiopsis sp. TS-821]PPS44896.1 deoxyguanosinetriphosphate triphosphohydrolase [Chroococcidiopsis sp. TS-821]
MSSMQWRKLLSRSRLFHNLNVEDSGRTAFEKDFDKIIFSSYFRRLKDKTQVFSLVDNDYIRSRLSHSLEASCVGRTLGTLVGQEIVKRHAKELYDYTARDFGDIVAAACLSHDIGNPPFGHAGEDAIQEWFKSPNAAAVLSLLTPGQQADFKCFEGNAQGFRILTKLDKPQHRQGLQFTCATLATFTKYPREAGINSNSFNKYNSNSDNKSTKKHGFFQEEKELFAQIAQEVGLIRRQKDIAWWCRHPLVFLVEAADDICYHIVDLEDGFSMGYIDYAEAKMWLIDILEGEKIEQFDDKKEQIKYLRAKAIHKLITEVKQVFLDCEEQLLSGTFDSPLTSQIASGLKLKEIIELTRKNVYEACEVVEVKVAGYQVLGGLLEEFVSAVTNNNLSKSYLTKKLLPNFKDTEQLYSKVLQVTDYISGMTDSYAVSLFKKIKGISLPRGGR